MLAVVFMAGCTGDSDGAQPAPESSPSESTPQTPPPDAGEFFTWEQLEPLNGQQARAAATQRAWEYFAGLGARYPGHTDQRWGEVSTPSFWKIQSAADDTETESRGPITLRLMGIQINGETAVVTSCRDARDAEFARTGSGDWKPDKPDVAPIVDKLRRSSTSPTGWVLVENAETDLDREDCERSFADDEPAVTETGLPGVFN